MENRIESDETRLHPHLFRWASGILQLLAMAMFERQRERVA